ncbi:conserved hypothetical protein [Carnobacterium maltaromaticum]|nr:conserved hypothetical protein [Carnobacterium maltaromaticum]
MNVQKEKYRFLAGTFFISILFYFSKSVAEKYLLTIEQLHISYMRIYSQMYI